LNNATGPCPDEPPIRELYSTGPALLNNERASSVGFPEWESYSTGQVG